VIPLCLIHNCSVQCFRSVYLSIDSRCKINSVRRVPSVEESRIALDKYVSLHRYAFCDQMYNESERNAVVLEYVNT